MTDTAVELIQPTIEEVVPYEDADDGKVHKAHIVRPTENAHITGHPNSVMTGQDVVDLARVMGEFVVALCGHKFVPKRDPEKCDACKSCIDIAGHIMSGLGE